MKTPSACRFPLQLTEEPCAPRAADGRAHDAPAWAPPTRCTTAAPTDHSISFAARLTPPPHRSASTACASRPRVRPPAASRAAPRAGRGAVRARRGRARPTRVRPARRRGHPPFAGPGGGRDGRGARPRGALGALRPCGALPLRRGRRGRPGQLRGSSWIPLRGASRRGAWPGRGGVCAERRGLCANGARVRLCAARATGWLRAAPRAAGRAGHAHHLGRALPLRRLGADVLPRRRTLPRARRGVLRGHGLARVPPARALGGQPHYLGLSLSPLSY